MFPPRAPFFLVLETLTESAAPAGQSPAPPAEPRLSENETLRAISAATP